MIRTEFGCSIMRGAEKTEDEDEDEEDEDEEDEEEDEESARKRDSDCINFLVDDKSMSDMTRHGIASTIQTTITVTMTAISSS